MNTITTRMQRIQGQDPHIRRLTKQEARADTLDSEGTGKEAIPDGVKHDLTEAHRGRAAPVT